ARLLDGGGGGDLGEHRRDGDAGGRHLRGPLGTGRRTARRRRRRVGHRQVEREGAAAPLRAHEVDLAAEQARELAADRETEAGAAVRAARAAIGLLERLEDELLL